MARDAASARVTNRGRRLKGFLDQRADEAGEIRQLTLQKRFAKRDVSENSLQRIGMSVIRRTGKQRARHLGPVVRGSDAKVILALKMMKERTLGDARRCAEFIH